MAAEKSESKAKSAPTHELTDEDKEAREWLKTNLPAFMHSLCCDHTLGIPFVPKVGEDGFAGTLIGSVLLSFLTLYSYCCDS